MSAVRQPGRPLSVNVRSTDRPLGCRQRSCPTSSERSGLLLHAWSTSLVQTAATATLRKWRATGQSRRWRSISPGAGQPSFDLVRLSAYASGHRTCRACVPCPPRISGQLSGATRCSCQVRKQVSTTTRARANSPLAAARLRSGSGRETLGRASCCSRATATAKSNPSAVGSRSGPWPGAPACCSTELRKSRAGQNRLRRVPDWNDLDRVDAGHAAGHPDRPDRSDAGVSDDHRGARARLREAVTTRSRSRRLRVRAAELQRVGRHQYVRSSGCQRVIVTGE